MNNTFWGESMKTSTTIKNLTSAKECILAWQQFLKKNDWRKLIDGTTPIQSGCGSIYELLNFLNRPNESLAIADMRQLSFSEPHYHPNNNVEIFFVLQGSALVVVKTEQRLVHKNDVVIISPNTAHFTIPDDQFVIAVVNTPSYRPKNYIVLTKSNSTVGFDYEQFRKLAHAIV